MSREKRAVPEMAVAGQDEQKVREELATLRDMTRRTGLVYEAQALQLRMWALGLFPVSEATIEVDDQERSLSYTLRLNDALPAGEDLEVRIETLETWVRSLLGDEWLVRISTKQKRGGKGKLLHRGQRKGVLTQGKTPEGAITEFKRYRPKPANLKLDDDPSNLPPLLRTK